MQQPSGFDPMGYLQVAGELAAAGEERRLRAAVSRAYYALFLMAREKTGAYPTSPRDNAHQFVIKALTKKRGFAVGNLLYHFKELRVAADYELVPSDPDKRDWVKNWTRAQRFIQRLLPEIQNI